MNDRDYAIVLGVNHYPGFRQLEGAIEDAERVHAWLVDPLGGGLPPGNCQLLRSSAPPPAPLQDAIDDAFVEVLRPPERRRRLYFYFSGHGVAQVQDDVSMCLAKWSETFRAMSLSYRGYHEALRDWARFEQIVIWLDCCRVRNFNVRGLGPTFPPPIPLGDAPQVRTMVGFATEFEDVAYEAGRGVFTNVLLEGLRGGAIDAETGRTTADRLRDYLERETPRQASALGLKQQARVVSEFNGEAAYDFGPRRMVTPNAHVRIEFSAERTGIIELEAPSGAILKREDATTGPWDLDLERDAVHVLRELRTATERVLRPRMTTGGPYGFRF
jgi:hypothetical protein